MSQVHSFLLGYLSGQLGLLRGPVGLWILCSHSATHTHARARAHAHVRAWRERERGYRKLRTAAAQEKGNEKGAGTERDERRAQKENREDGDLSVECAACARQPVSLEPHVLFQGKYRISQCWRTPAGLSRYTGPGFHYNQWTLTLDS